MRWPFGEKNYRARPDECDFISDALIEKGPQGDSSHTIIVEFKEPVRDGNKVSHYNILRDGQALHSENLFTGETKIKLGLDPIVAVYEFVFANEDKEVLMTDRVRVEIDE